MSNINKGTKTQSKSQGRIQETPNGSSKKSIITSQKSGKGSDSPVKNEMIDTHYSQKSSATYMEGGLVDDGVGGESVKVALRIRPMNSMEYSRGDEYCLKVMNDKAVQIRNKGASNQYQFSAVLHEKTSQTDVYNRCNIVELINSTLDGYSATVFAYGQTGSGKTYTMAGNEEKLGKEVYVSDDTEGIMPRAVRQLWKNMGSRNEQFYIKASYTEIYNEQLRDLLNPASGVLHCRWNINNGFFVEDLMIVECTSVDDLVAVMHEGMKNRKSASHELNKDSSRSHSILTIYVIAESLSGNHGIKKYGKLSFVDLAGSERLKESKSNGEMIKETGNINKSLFTLGKVISGLSDKKNRLPYIPYRDSKLTMLLMDSLGGTAKALMIACVNPSMVYYEETLSTLKYATRTMNIKNKPIMQMDAKDQVIFNLNKEKQLIILENQYLKEQLQRVTNGLPIDMPDFMGGKNKSLPPLVTPVKQPNNSRPLANDVHNMELPINKIMSEYQYELERLRSENEDIRMLRENAEKNFNFVMNDYNVLQIKLENLENLFIGNPIAKGESRNGRQSMGEEYLTSALMLENTDLKKRVSEMEEKNMEVSHQLKSQMNGNPLAMADAIDPYEKKTLKEANEQLQQKMEYLQKRERELLESLLKIQRISAVNSDK